MVNGLKRPPPTEAQSRNKRARTPAKTVKFVDDSKSRNEGNNSDEGTEDEGGDETQNLTKTAEQINKIVAQIRAKDDWPRAFGKLLDDKQSLLRQKFSDLKEKMTSDKQALEESIIPLLRTALAPIDSDETSTPTPSKNIEVRFTAAKGQPYCERLADLIAESHELVYTYKAVAELECQPSRLGDLSLMFDKDKAAALGAIAAGKRVALRDVECLLADKNHEVRGRSGLTVEDEQRGRHLLSQGGADEEREEIRSVGWGNVGYDIQWAVNKLSNAGQMQ